MKLGPISNPTFYGLYSKKNTHINSSIGMDDGNKAFDLSALITDDGDDEEAPSSAPGMPPPPPPPGGGPPPPPPPPGK